MMRRYHDMMRRRRVRFRWRGFFLSLAYLMVTERTHTRARGGGDLQAVDGLGFCCTLG